MDLRKMSDQDLVIELDLMNKIRDGLSIEIGKRLDELWTRRRAKVHLCLTL